MPEVEILEKEIKDLKEAKAELETKLAKADISKLEERITNLSTELEANAAEMGVLRQELEAAKKEKEEKDEEYKKTKSELESALEQISRFEAEAAEMQKKEKMMKRKAQLTSAGVEDEEASTTVASFENLSDEQFELVVQLAQRSSQAGKEKEEKKEEKKEDNTKAAEKALETVVVEKDVALAQDASDVEDEVSKTRAELSALISSSLNKAKK